VGTETVEGNGKARGKIDTNVILQLGVGEITIGVKEDTPINRCLINRQNLALRFKFRPI